MSKHQRICVICVVSVVLSVGYLWAKATPAHAAVPKMLNYQGRLTDENDSLYDGTTVYMKFDIFDAASGGSELWSSDEDNGGGNETCGVEVTPSGGVFNIAIGNTALSWMADLDLDFNAAAYYLEIKIQESAFCPGAEGDYETLDPRQRVLSSGYSINADTVDGLDSGSFLRSDAADVFNEDGADIDLRFEGDTDANLFFLDASTDYIGIGTVTPAQKLHVEGQCVTGDTLLPVVREISNNKSQITNKSQVTNHKSQIDTEQFGASNLGIGNCLELGACDLEFTRIDAVERGMYVLSLDEKTGQLVPAKIKGLLDMGVQPVFRLTTEDGRTIRTTGNHPYLTRDGWKKVVYLKVGQEIAVASQQKTTPSSGSLADNYTDVVVPDLSKHNLSQEKGFVKSQFEANKGVDLGGVEPPLPDLTGQVPHRRRPTPSLLFQKETTNTSASWTKVDHQKTPLSGDLVHLTSLLNGWIDTLEDKVSQEEKFVKPQFSKGVDSPGVEPCRFGVSIQPNKPVEPAPKLLSQSDLENSRWTKVIYLEVGDLIAVANFEPSTSNYTVNRTEGSGSRYTVNRTEGSGSRYTVNRTEGSGSRLQPYVAWDTISSIEYVGEEQVYDISVEGTQNFIGNGIVAHNTYISGNLGIGTTGPGAKLEVVGQCVTGDSELITEEGRVLRVDEVKGGEKVYSLDENTGKLVPAKVKTLLDMGWKQTFELTTEDGKKIVTTGNHPYLTREGWQKVVYLKENQEIAAADLVFSPVQIDEEHKNNQEGPGDISNVHNLLPFSQQDKTNNRNTNQNKENVNLVENFTDIDHFSPFFTNLTEIIKSVKEAKPPKVASPNVGRIAEGKTLGKKYPPTVDKMAAFDKSSQYRERSLYWEETNFNFINTNDNTKTTGNVKRAKRSPVPTEGLVLGWVKIASIKPAGVRHVWDLSIEGTHNFVANGIIAHNTYITDDLYVGSMTEGITNASFALDGDDAYIHDLLGVGDDLYVEDTVVVGSSTTISSSDINFSGNSTLTLGGNLKIGTNALYVSGTSGNIGIGTTNPGAKLELAGNFLFSKEAARSLTIGRTTTAATGGYDLTLSASGAVSGGTNLSGGNAYLTSGISTGSGGSNIYFQTSGGGAAGTADRALTTRMTILGSGNVGIGTTGPQGILDIASAEPLVYFDETDQTDPAGDFRFGVSGDSFYIQGRNAADNAYLNHMIIARSGSIYLNAAQGSGGIVLQTGGTNKVTLQADGDLIVNAGNLGIGTTGPSQLLNVYGASATSLIQSSSGNATYALRPASAASGRLDFQNSAGTVKAIIASVDASDGLQFYTNGTTEQMRILSNGNVGIGTTAPTNLLHLYAGANRKGISISSDGNASAFGDIGMGAITTSGFTTGLAQDWNISYRKDGYFSGSTANTGMSMEFYAAKKGGGYYAPLSFQSDGDVILASGQNATTGNVGIGTTGPVRTIDVVGNWGGNTYAQTESTTNTYTVSTKALMYFLSCTAGGVTAITCTYNITGLSNTEGSFAFIYTQAYRSGSGNHTTIVQINGTQISSLLSGSAGVYYKEYYIVAYVNGAWSIVNSPSTSDTYDFAEWTKYAGQRPGPGEIVSISNEKEKVKRTTQAQEKGIVGTVSTNPHTVIGESSPDAIPLALSGRVPVLITTENGPIRSGEYITSSSVPGMGMRSAKAGQTVGKVMEEFDPENGKGEIIDCPEGTPEEVTCGRIMVFINIGWFDPSATSEKLAVNENGDIAISGNVGIGTTGPDHDLEIGTGTYSEIDAGEAQFTTGSSRDYKENINPIFVDNILEKIANVPVNTYDFREEYCDGGDAKCKDKLGLISEDFYTVFGRGDDKSIRGQEVQMALWLGVQELAKRTEGLKEQQGEIEALEQLADADNTDILAWLKERLASVAGSVRVFQNVVAGRIITPLLESRKVVAKLALLEETKTDIISPLTDGKLVIRMNANDNSANESEFGGMLEIQNKEGEPVVTVDGFGNLTASGSGTFRELTAYEIIRSRAVETEIINSEWLMVNEATVSGDLTVGEPTINNSQLTVHGQVAANEITAYEIIRARKIVTEGIEAEHATFTETLQALGSTSLVATTIAGPLSQDGTLLFTEGKNIDVVGDALYLQSEGLGAIDFIAGAMKLDEEGNLVVSGQLTVAKGLFTDKIAPASGEKLVLEGDIEATGSARFGDLIEAERASFGSLLAKTVNSEKITAESISTKDLILEGKIRFSTEGPDRSAGVETILAGTRAAVVSTSLIEEDSYVFLTSQSSTAQTLYVEEKVPGAYFVVSLDEPVTTDLEFAWLLLD